MWNEVYAEFLYAKSSARVFVYVLSIMPASWLESDTFSTSNEEL